MVTMTQHEFRKLATFIKQMYGIHLKEEKTALLIGRLHRMIQERGFQSFTAYHDYLVADKTGKALTELVNRVSTNHTFL